MTALIYNRTVSINRPGTIPVPSGGTPSVVVTGYGGVTDGTETTLYTGLMASIQVKSAVRQHLNALPADTRAPYVWSVFLQKSAVPLGGIENRDIVIDELGNRYQVESAQWGLLGYHLRCRLLEV